jgi:Lrp/AsnC family transcriptional regulator
VIEYFGKYDPKGALLRNKRVMDSIDRQLLELVQQDISLPMSRLAKKVGISTTACWNRIRRLESDAVIVRRVALVDPSKVDMGLTVFVSIRVSEHSSEWLSRFAARVSAMPEVVEFYRMAGDVDYMLRVMVPDMAAYDEFYKGLIEGTSFADVTSRFSMERIKQTTAIPIR